MLCLTVLFVAFYGATIFCNPVSASRQGRRNLSGTCHITFDLITDNHTGNLGCRIIKQASFHLSLTLSVPSTFTGTAFLPFRFRLQIASSKTSLTEPCQTKNFSLFRPCVSVSIVSTWELENGYIPVVRAKLLQSVTTMESFPPISNLSITPYQMKSDPSANFDRPKTGSAPIIESIHRHPGTALPDDELQALLPNRGQTRIGRWVKLIGLG